MPEFLNILLQKSDPYLSWGFDVVGGREYGLPLTICEVSSNSFSSQYLSKGDEIIRIEGIDASLFTETEALSFIQKPSKSLDLVIYKRSKENLIHTVNRSANEFENNSRRRPRELNLKSNFQCYFAVPEKKLTRLEKKRIYKRSSSVPPPAPPTYDYEDFHNNSSGSAVNYDPRWATRVDSVRDRSASPPFWRNNEDRRRNGGNSRNSRRFWRQMESGVSDVECDHEVARYCRSSRWHNRSSSVDSNFECESSQSTANFNAKRNQNKTEVTEEYKYRIPVQFDYYEHRERQSRLEQHQRKNISTVYLSPYDYRMQNNIIKSLEPLRRGVRRQTSQSSDKGTEVQTSSESGLPKVPVETSNAAPPAPAPPPPPPPTMNGCIPTIRLKSEIPEHCEPPAKLHNAMMKDKKPFTYTPGGIDLSEIKSPRMQRRIVRNAQTPDDIILPTTTTVNTNTLPPSAVAAMTPQIAIPVFPQNGLQKKSPNPPPPPKRSPAPSPTPKAPTQEPVSNNSSPQKQQIPRTVVVTKDQPEKTTEQPRVQVGSLYVPPVSEPQQSKPAFPTLREAPTPWLQKHQQPQEESKPAWVNRNKNNGETEQKQVIYERKPRVQQVQVEKESVEPEKPATGTRVIPIQLEGSNQTVTQPNSRQNSQRWVTDGGNQAVLSNNKNNLNRTSVNSNKSFTEPDSKPIQSRSFKVLQKITGSEDDNTDFSSDVPYNTEGVPLSQLRRLHLCDDDQAFMNKVKSQVDEDIFLHTETDPRYRGSAIPSKAFRMLQNMTESGQVIPTTIEVQNQAKPKPSGPRENENEQQQKKYIPPSERQAEQEFRKYMGSSIPSRSFRMLQAMTATQDTTTRPPCMDESDF